MTARKPDTGEWSERHDVDVSGNSDRAGWLALAEASRNVIVAEPPELVPPEVAIARAEADAAKQAKRK